MIMPRVQHGYALLMTLVLVMIAGAVLMGVARRSVAGALEAKDAVEELQRRWAVASCRATLLGAVEELLDDAEQGDAKRSDDQSDDEHAKTYHGKPVGELRVTLRLADSDFMLVLTDEQAKLSANHVLSQTNRADAQLVLRRLLNQISPGDSEQVVVNLRPLSLVRQSSVTDQRMQKIGAYGQVFDGASPVALIGENGMTGLASAITCWGDGRVNLRRAPAAVVRQACGRGVDPEIVEALLVARDRDPYRKLSTSIGELRNANDKQKAKLADYLTDQSQCHGLWVIVRGRQRSWYTLAIREGNRQAKVSQGVASAHEAVRQDLEFSW